MRFLWTFVGCLCAVLEVGEPVAHEMNLLWTIKSKDTGVARIMSIAGDPEEWIRTGTFSQGNASPLDLKDKVRSHRLGLTFKYATRELYWSDRGFKEIFRSQLSPQVSKPYNYTVNVHQVYTGISPEVHGMALDWLSGSLYWTDALYNWITVCSANQYEIYKHLVTTGLDRPMGIAVYPQKGKLFWSDWGVRPKIEMSDLMGKNRRTFIQQNLKRPLGMTVEFTNDYLYWVDDSLDTIEWASITTGEKLGTIQLRSTSSLPAGNNLYGIAVYKTLAFVTDQSDDSIKIVNLSNGHTTGTLDMTGSIPHDITLYSSYSQANVSSDCSRMSCQHMCISQGNGGGTCMCSQGYLMNPDSRTCTLDPTNYMPSYIYSVGNRICSTRVQVTDRMDIPVNSDVNCFKSNTKHVKALDFHAASDRLFYSDSVDKTITSAILNGSKPEILAINIGEVRGLAVDWLSFNLYWTDEEHEHIMVMRLDGRYPNILPMKDVKKPAGIVVDPVHGYLFWTSGDGFVYKSWTDGSNKTPLIQGRGSPDGMALDPNKEKYRIYWADGTAIYTASLDGSDKKQMNKGNRKKVEDVAIFNDYFVFTDGNSAVYFGQKDTGRVLKGAEHLQTSVSHDIIAYSEYQQPIVPSGCDDDNGGCDQLCFPVPQLTSRKRICGCSFGYDIGTDQKSCVAKPVTDFFVLFSVPYYRAIYQIDLRQLKLIAIPIKDLNRPTSVTYDYTNKRILWIDVEAKVIESSDLDGSNRNTIETLPQNSDVTGFEVDPGTKQILYSDEGDIGFQLGKRRRRRAIGDVDYTVKSVPGSALVIDQDSGVYFWARKLQTDTTIYMKKLESGADISHRVWYSTAQETVSSLAVDKVEKQLYWSIGTAIFRGSYNGTNVKQIYTVKSSQTPINNLALSPGHVYFTQEKSREVFRIKKDGSSFAPVSNPYFSSIVGLKAFWQDKSVKDTGKEMPKDNTNNGAGNATGGEGPITTTHIIILAALLGLVTIAMIALIAFLLYRRRKQAKKPPQSNFNTPAHDNPTYVTQGAVQRPEGSQPYEAPVAAPTPDPDYETLPPPRDGGAVAMDYDPKKSSKDMPLPQLPGVEDYENLNEKRPLDDEEYTPMDKKTLVDNESSVNVDPENAMSQYKVVQPPKYEK